MLESLHTGHASRPRAFWPSKSSAETNHPSKRWRSAQMSSNTITFAFLGKYSTAPGTYRCANALFQGTNHVRYAHIPHSAAAAIQTATITRAATPLTGRALAILSFARALHSSRIG